MCVQCVCVRIFLRPSAEIGAEIAVTVCWVCAAECFKCSQSLAAEHRHTTIPMPSHIPLALSFSLSGLVCRFPTPLLLTSLPPLRSHSFSLFLPPYLVFQDLPRSSSSWVQDKSGFQLVSERMNKPVVEFYNHLNRTISQTVCAVMFHSTLRYVSSCGLNVRSEPPANFQRN